MSRRGLAARINELLEGEVVVSGDCSLLAQALGDAPVDATELAYRRVEALLAAWLQMHRAADSQAQQ